MTSLMAVKSVAEMTREAAISAGLIERKERWSVATSDDGALYLVSMDMNAVDIGLDSGFLGRSTKEAYSRLWTITRTLHAVTDKSKDN